jgi:hypothetical protein
MASYLYIDGADATAYRQDGTTQINAQLGGRSELSMVIVDKTGAYLPSVRESIYLIEDPIVAVGSMAFSGTTGKTVVVPTASFTSADIGKIIEIPTAGPNLSVLHATIMSITNGTTVVTNRFSYQAATSVSIRWGFREFGGIIQHVGSQSIVDGIGVLASISAQDFGGVLDRRSIKRSFAEGFTLRQVCDTLGVEYLDSNGVFFDTDMPSGSTLPALNFDRKSMTEVLNQLVTLTQGIDPPGVVWRIDYAGVITMQPASTTPTPVTLSDANANILLGGSGETESTGYANRIIVRYGSGTKEVTETLSGDGATREFPLTYTPLERPPQVYDVQAAAFRNVGVHGTDTLFEWTYRASDNAIVQLADAPPGTAHAALAIGESATVTFVAQFPAEVEESDAAQIVANGDYDKVVEAPTVFDSAAASAIAVGELELALQEPTTLKVFTFARGFAPGQYGPITSALHPVASGSYLIQGVSSALWPTVPERWHRTLTAIGTTSQGKTWLDWYRGLGGGGSGGGSSSVTVGTPPAPVPAAGGSTPFFSFVGGADPERRFIAASSGVWFDAPHAFDIVVDTDRTGLLALRLHLIVSNGAMTIQPRIVNTSTGSTQVGIGASVSPTSYTYQAFYLTGTPSGLQVYRLQFNVNSTVHEYGFWQVICDNAG